MPVPVVMYVIRHVRGNGAFVCTLPAPPRVTVNAVGYTNTIMSFPVVIAMAEVAAPKFNHVVPPSGDHWSCKLNVGSVPDTVPRMAVMTAPRELALVCVAPLKVVAVIIVGASPVVVFVFDDRVDVTVPETITDDPPDARGTA